VIGMAWGGFLGKGLYATDVIAIAARC